MTAVRPVSQRGDAQRRGGETRNVSRSNMPQMDAPSNPAEPHGRVSQPLLERCVHVAGAPLDPRRPCGGARPARCGSMRRPSARCLPFTVPVLARVIYSFCELVPDCGPAVPRSVRVRDNRLDTSNFFLGRPTVDNRRFSSARPRRRDPRGRDHFHARIRARTAYRTAFPRAPRAHAASPSPRASRLVPSRLRPFRPPRISSPRHAR